MDISLNSGSGCCPASSQLSIRATPSVIELGAVMDVLHAALNAAHHANRHCNVDDRVAVALPGLHEFRGRVRPGHEVVLFGSEQALESYLKLDGVATLLRRAMIIIPEIMDSWLEEGETGTAYIRDRRVARRSPGAQRRARARAARRGKPFPAELKSRDVGADTLALHYGSAVVHVRPERGSVSLDPINVNTYGFSSMLAPAVLPIQADLLPAWNVDAT